MRHLTFACLAPIILAFAASVAHAEPAAENLKALKGAFTCYNDSLAAFQHISKLADSQHYVPARTWNVASCDLALLVSTKSGSTDLTRTLTTFTAAFTTLAAEVDALIVKKGKPVVATDVADATSKLRATLEGFAMARTALRIQIDRETTEFQRSGLAALAKKEKKKKVKSTSFYQLTLNVAEADLRAALEAKDHDAFNKQLPTIQDAVAALATGPDAELLADYCAAVVQMHKAASAITPAWGDAEVKAFRAAQQAAVAAFNAL